MTITASLEHPLYALHVENDSSWREKISKYLSHAGFHVKQTDNLNDALFIARNLRLRKMLRILISDGTFPLERGGCAIQGMGLTLHDEIRKNHENDKLDYLVLSGDSSLKSKCDERGIGFMYKGDFNPDIFINYLKSLIFV